MSKYKAKVDSRDLRMLLGKISKRVEDNIKTVLRDEALPHLVDLVMIGFDNLADRADMLPEDPTNPGNWREEFKTHLLEDIYHTFGVTGTTVTVQIGDKQFLGYGNDDSRDDQPLQWMVYYLEGLAGDWAFISPETYSLFRNPDYDSRWGRFGTGFMISREQFDAEGWGSVIPFEQVRHPFSGYAPLDIFAEAIREFNLRPFISKAITAAIKGQTL